jgi:hypothetical protein
VNVQFGCWWLVLAHSGTSNVLVLLSYDVYSDAINVGKDLGHFGEPHPLLVNVRRLVLDIPFRILCLISASVAHSPRAHPQLDPDIGLVALH